MMESHFNFIWTRGIRLKFHHTIHSNTLIPDKLTIGINNLTQIPNEYAWPFLFIEISFVFDFIWLFLRNLDWVFIRFK